MKVLDFGIAKHFVHLEADSTLTVTTPGHTPGTVDYMSPEQLLGQRIDQRSDLFALGVSLYEVLTGRTPFRARTKLATMANILQRSAPRCRRCCTARNGLRCCNGCCRRSRTIATRTPPRCCRILRCSSSSSSGAASPGRRHGQSLVRTWSRRWPSSHSTSCRPSPIATSESVRSEYFSHGLMDELIAA